MLRDRWNRSRGMTQEEIKEYIQNALRNSNESSLRRIEEITNDVREMNDSLAKSSDPNYKHPTYDEMSKSIRNKNKIQ